MQATIGLTPHDMELRRDRITASEVSAVMGTSPWRTQYDLYLEKCVEMKPLETLTLRFPGRSLTA